VKLICQLGQQYVSWMKSDPFDIGNTTRLGIRALQDNLKSLQEYEGEEQ
jgi:hypothetical protein